MSRSFGLEPDNLLEEGSYAAGEVGGIGAEGACGGGGIWLVVVEAAGEASEVVGGIGDVYAGAVMDDAEAALDGSPEVVGFEEVAEGVGREEACAAEGFKGVPKVGAEDMGMSRGVSELKVVDQEFDIGEAAVAAFEVVPRASVFKFLAHRDDFTGELGLRYGELEDSEDGVGDFLAESTAGEDDAGASERESLPGLSGALEIALEGFEGDNERA